MKSAIRRSVPITISMLALFGCGAADKSESDSVASQTEALANAVPQAEDLHLAMPSDPAGPETEAVPIANATCIGALPAEFAALTHQVTGDANGLAEGVFAIVAQVMSTPPAVAAPDHAVWGPLSDPSSPSVYKLEVTKIDPQTFNFALSGRPKAADDASFIPVLMGVTTMPDPKHRASEMSVDFDARYALDPSSDPVAGKVGIHYENADGVRHVELTLGGIVGPNAPAPNDVLYRF